jgi:hypothetical protein
MGKARLAFFAAFVALVCGIASGGQTPPPAKPAQPVAWTEHYRKATVSFGQIVAANGMPAFDPIGTGVVVCTDDHHAFIVTAKHIFSDPSKDWFPAALAVRFSNQEKQTFTEQLGIPIQLVNEKHEVDWSSLDDSSDIAAIATPDAFRSQLTDCIGLQDFATDNDVYDGATVFTFGFPTAGGALAGPNGLVRAITRSGIIAWTDPAGATDHALLLDSNVLPGNSGGPAFKVPSGLDKFGSFAIGGRVAFLGIVTSGLVGPVQVGDHPLQVQAPGALFPSVAGVAGVGALARVEPAAKIRALVTAMASSQK